LNIPQEKVHDFPDNCPRLEVPDFDEIVAGEDFKNQGGYKECHHLRRSKVEENSKV
jgi:hypothetical protein